MTTAAILADPIGYQVRPAPLREPPFEDEQRAEPPSRRLGPNDRPLPLPGPSPEAPSRLRLAVLAEDRFDARPTGRLELPEPAAFARRLLIAVIETATGRRSAGQLSQHTTLAVQAGLARDAGRISRLGTMSRPAAVHSVHLTEPADGVAEVVGVVRVGPRFRAIALRLEGLDGRWRCVRLQIG
ncbi:MAG TPA: Rv3235 family protein [Jatrophihabitans sp.]|nr:Rv3235 family protein [Jatrophihabitans sp.]